MTWQIKSSLPIEYSIDLVDNVLLLDRVDSERKIIVIDKLVYELYQEKLVVDNAKILLVECTELTKSRDHAYKILSFFEDQKVLRRSEPVIVIGGGVLLDLVGFCCSIYRRGIPYVRVPTTLLAMVDASVGVKTGINIFDRRNRVGSYFPPQQTLIDTSFINTQDARQIANGYAEIIKLAIACDLTLFELLENRADQTKIVERAISIMVDQLEDNLWEKDLERPVDFGHTFSPVIEMKNVTELLHGEAVILDCLLSSKIANNRELLSDSDFSRIKNLITSYGLPTSHIDFTDANLIYSGLQDVVNHRDGRQNAPLPTGIGTCIIVDDISLDEISSAAGTMVNANA